MANHLPGLNNSPSPPPPDEDENIEHGADPEDYEDGLVQPRSKLDPTDEDEYDDLSQELKDYNPSDATYEKNATPTARGVKVVGNLVGKAYARAKTTWSLAGAVPIPRYPDGRPPPIAVARGPDAWPEESDRHAMVGKYRKADGKWNTRDGMGGKGKGRSRKLSAADTDKVAERAYEEVRDKEYIDVDTKAVRGKIKIGRIPASRRCGRSNASSEGSEKFYDAEENLEPEGEDSDLDGVPWPLSPRTKARHLAKMKTKREAREKEEEKRKQEKMRVKMLQEEAEARAAARGLGRLTMGHVPDGDRDRHGTSAAGPSRRSGVNTQDKNIATASSRNEETDYERRRRKLEDKRAARVLAMVAEHRARDAAVRLRNQFQINAYQEQLNEQRHKLEREKAALRPKEAGKEDSDWVDTPALPSNVDQGGVEIDVGVFGKPLGGVQVPKVMRRSTAPAGLSRESSPKEGVFARYARRKEMGRTVAESKDEEEEEL